MHKNYHRKPGTDPKPGTQTERMPVETRLRHYTSGAAPRRARTTFWELFGERTLWFPVTPNQRRRLTHKHRALA